MSDKIGMVTRRGLINGCNGNACKIVSSDYGFVESGLDISIAFYLLVHSWRSLYIIKRNKLSIIKI